MAGAIQALTLEEWRSQNCHRIAWDLFALVIGPKLEHPDDFKIEDGDTEEYKAWCEAQQAFFTMVDRVLKHGFDEGFLNMTEMTTEERAFAVCLEDLFDRYNTEDGWLLDRAIFKQTVALGLGTAHHNGEISTAEVVARIDDWRGGPEWRQIAATNAEQKRLDAIFGIPTISEIPNPGRGWVDPGHYACGCGRPVRCF